MQPENTYTGIDLLNMVFEFTGMEPNKKYWHYWALQNNPPRLVRLQRIAALMQALGITGAPESWIDKAARGFNTDMRIIPIESFLNGDFIKNRHVTDYNEVHNLLSEIISQHEGEEEKLSGTSLHHYTFVYQYLVQYKKWAYKLLTFNSGIIEASIWQLRGAMYITGEVSDRLHESIPALDNTLELLINPHRLKFTQSQLIQQYSFPDVNLLDLDMEWL